MTLRPACGVLLAALAAAGALRGQDWQRFDGLDRTGVAVRVLMVTGGGIGGQGYAIVEVDNGTDAAQGVRFGYETAWWGTGDARCEREVALGPREHGRWFLPVPAVPGGDAMFRAAVAGREETERLPMTADASDAVLLVSRRPEMLDRLVQVLPGKPGCRVVLPRDLPPDWPLLSAFRAVVVDSSAALDAPAQELLRRFAAAGGVVLVAGIDGLRAGPLRDLLEEAGAQPLPQALPLGLGRVASAAPLEAVHGQVREVWRAQFDAPRPFAGPLPALLLPRAIPGLGEVPVRAFLVVILLFAVAVGPVNFLVLRRRRRPLLALLTVPVLGFGTTAVILLYGMFHDGFGVRGVRYGIAALDQRGHEVAAVTAQTLFAGISPPALEVGPGTMVDCLEALTSTRNTRAHRLDYRDGRLGGDLLPSRTSTTLVTTLQAPARARLQFRRRDDGGLDLLAAQDLEPAAGAPFVLRDQTGQYHLREGGALLPAPARRAERAVGELLERLLHAPLADSSISVRIGRERFAVDRGQMADQLRRCLLPGNELRPGSYLGWFAAVPWAPDHGLAVERHADGHLVVGHPATEDFLP